MGLRCLELSEYSTEKNKEWSLPRGKVSFVDEESYFQKTLGFSREDFKKAWKGTNSPRDFGWWWQQLLKLGVGQCIEDISENFCVWDADLIVLDAWPLADSSHTQCYVAPLQDIGTIIVAVIVRANSL